MSNGQGLLFNYLFSLEAPPKISLPDQAPVLRIFIGDKLDRLGTSGTLPINLTLAMNSTVLVNEANTQEFMFTHEGNYSCTATNKYGSVKVHFRVIFIGEYII